MKMQGNISGEDSALHLRWQVIFLEFLTAEGQRQDSFVGTLSAGAHCRDAPFLPECPFDPR
jgi:hypothetical protein